MYTQIKEAAEKRYPEIIEVAKWLVNTDRGSQYMPGLNKAAEYIKGLVEAMGCTTEIHTDDTYGPTLVATKRGRGKTRILMFAHMDTVWPEGYAKKVPFTIKDNMAYGAGVSDCVPGMIGQIFTLQVLNDIGFNDYGELILLFNPDEEISSPSSGKWIQHYAKRADVGFCMEGPNFDDEYITERSGSIYFELAVEGVKAHAGVEPEKGRNAIAELCYQLNLLQQLRISGATISISDIEGGSGICIVADNARALFRFSIKNMEVREEVIQVVENTVSHNQLIEGTKVILIRPTHIGFNPLEKLPATKKFCELVETTSLEVLGHNLKESSSRGADDAHWCNSTGTPTLDGLTPVSYKAHAIDECLDLNTVVPRITLCAELIRRINLDDTFLKNGRG